MAAPSPANCAAAVSVPVFHAAAQITPAAAVVPPVQPATAPVMFQQAEQMMPVPPAAAVPPQAPTTAPVIPVIPVYLSSDAPPLAMSLKRL